MRLLTGQLCNPETGGNPPSQALTQQDQAEMLASFIQNNNLNGMAGIQNLMNNQILQGMSNNQTTPSSIPMNNIMASMMGMSNLGQSNLPNNHIPNSTQNQPLTNQNTQNSLGNQNLQSEQLLSTLMNGNPPWNMPQMAGMNGNFQNMDTNSLNELINNQMMNFNTNFVGSQDNNNRNLPMNNPQNSFPPNPPK